MAIGEAHRSGSTFTGLVAYVLAQGIYAPQNKDKKPEVVFSNHIFDTNYLEIGKAFKELSDNNKRVQKPVMHLTVNFKIDEDISTPDQLQFVKRVMEEMGVREDNHQYLVVRHNDKHPHYHIIINRVGFDGKTLSDSNSKYRIGTACDKIEKKMGLDNYLSNTRAFVYDEKTNGFKKNTELRRKNTVTRTRNREIGIQEKKDHIQIATMQALQDIKVNTLEILQNRLKQQEIDFHYTVNKREQVAVSFRYKGLAVKGSKVSLKGNMIRNQLQLNAKAMDQGHEKDSFLKFIDETDLKFRNSIKELVDLYNSGKQPDLKTVFAKNGINFNNELIIQYKNWQLDCAIIKQFDASCKMKLAKAQKVYEQQLKSYEVLQNSDFKKGLLGIITPEQKKYNELLKEKKESSSVPKLTVGITADDFIKSVHAQMKHTYVDIKAIPIVQEKAFTIDESIQLKDSKQESNPQKWNSNPGISGSEDEEEKKRKKRRFRK